MTPFFFGGRGLLKPAEKISKKLSDIELIFEAQGCKNLIVYFGNY